MTRWMALFALVLGAGPACAGSGQHRHGGQDIVFVLYTVHRNVMKMTVQIHPTDHGDPCNVFLLVKRGDRWLRAAQSTAVKPGWTIHFRVAEWDMKKSADSVTRLPRKAKPSRHRIRVK